MAYLDDETEEERREREEREAAERREREHGPLVDAYFAGLDEPEEPEDGPGLAETPSLAPDEPRTVEVDYSDAEVEAPGSADAAALEASRRAIEEANLPPPGDAYALDMGSEPSEADFARAAAEAPPDDPEAMARFDAGETAEPYDRNPGTEDMDMREWQDTPSDPEPEPDALGEPAEAWSPLTTGGGPAADLMPEDVAFGGPADEALVEAAMAEDPNVEGVGGYATDEDPTLPGRERLAATDLMDPFAEPDADEMGGPPDGDADDLEERSAELSPESFDAAPPTYNPATKGTPYDEPLEEPDFTGADWSDAIRRPLHAIGAGLLASSGRGSASPFRSDRAAMEAMLRERDEAKGAATESMATREARAAERDADRASREGIASMRDETTRVRDASRAALGAAAQSTRETEAASRIADRSSRITEREESSDPDSDTSDRARSRLPAMVAGLPPELAETIRPELEAMGEDLSADDVAALERMPATAWRAWLTRRRGLGGGSPGGGTGAGASSTSATLAEALRARGDTITDEEAAAMRPADLSARLRTVLGATGEAEIIDGVYGDAALIGSPTSVERRNLRASVIRARRASGALSDLAAIADEWGAAGALPETAEADSAAAIRTLMAYSTALGETGIISPGEVESIRAELPNPASLRELGLGGFTRRLESWRQSVVGSIEDDLEARGVSSDSMDRALGWIASGSFDGAAGAATAGGGGGVRVRDPETGETVMATEEQARELEAAGFEVLR